MKLNLLPLTILIIIALSSCDDFDNSDGYYFENDYEEGVDELENTYDKTNRSQENNSDQMPTPVETSLPDDLEEKGVADVQDQEFKPESVKDLINVVLTDKKLDTNKVVANIINNLQYISQQPMGISFSCEYFGYFTTNLLIPMGEGEEFVAMYLPQKFGNKKYHFVLFNFKGAIGCKDYSITCKRSAKGYNELFVFWPENEDQRTQCGMIIAVSDNYLQETKTRLNINWRIGEEDASYQSYGNVEYLLEKDVL